MRNLITVCHFGVYNKAFSRNRNVVAALRSQNIYVTECAVEATIPDLQLVGNPIYLLKYLLRGLLGRLQVLTKFIRYYKRCDYILVGSPGNLDLPFAKLLGFFLKKPVIYDPLISIYDTYVLDRKVFKKGSLLALLVFYFDKLLFKLADVVLFDTYTHIEYICKLFQLKDKTKFKRVFVGADESVAVNDVEVKNLPYFRVLFVGTFIPLHGTDIIVKAANLLKEYESIKFVLVGNGQTYKNTVQMIVDLCLKNIEINDPVESQMLPNLIKESAVCLGIFSSGTKAGNVIPTKVFQYSYIGTAIITRSSCAIEEIYTNYKDIILCNSADPRDLADKILLLYKDNNLRQRLVNNSKTTYSQNASCEGNGRQLEQILLSLKK